MRLSTIPFTGTDSARGVTEYSKVQTANTAARYLRVAGRIRILWFMVRLLRRRWFNQDLGFGTEIDDLEAERIPSAGLRILCGIRKGVLHGRHPMGKCFLGSRTLARGFQIS